MLFIVELNFDAEITRTPEAILFDFGDEERWIPISCIDMDMYQAEDTLMVKQSFVDKHGFDLYEA